MLMWLARLDVYTSGILLMGLKQKDLGWWTWKTLLEASSLGLLKNLIAHSLFQMMILLPLSMVLWILNKLSSRKNWKSLVTSCSRKNFNSSWNLIQNFNSSISTENWKINICCLQISCCFSFSIYIFLVHCFALFSVASVRSLQWNWPRISPPQFYKYKKNFEWKNFFNEWNA